MCRTRHWRENTVEEQWKMRRKQKKRKRKSNRQKQKRDAEKKDAIQRDAKLAGVMNEAQRYKSLTKKI